MSIGESIDFVELHGESELVGPEMYAANLIEWAVERHASDLFVSDMEGVVVVAIRRLGKIETVRTLARGYGHKLQGHLRILAGADVGEHIRPTDGRGEITTPAGRNVDLRLSCLPTLWGQDVAIRLFDPIHGARSIESLGYDEYELRLLRRLLGRPAGLILVAGPVASGKSSTLYAAIEALNDGRRKIHTLEDPVEHALPGVMQSQVNLRAGLDFADLLAAVLRHSPDVIMIGEIRDSKTVATAVRAGVSGQLVLATIHAKSAAEAIDSMIQYGANPKFLASALIGVINQRLVRRLCHHCRLPVEDGSIEINDAIAARLGGQLARVHRAIGCNHCFDDGFGSLTTVAEIMEIDRQLSDAIASEATAGMIQDMAQRNGMLTLADSAMLRVARGETTPVEANQVIADSRLASLALVQ